ncbi:transposase [Streptomyces coeruleorubidus]|uniref:transposase n=1 Tax=Streptomyces coeruleorubidus TaxID=116188 RepID=UPI0033DDF8E8
MVTPLLPSFAARPQGGGTAPRDERAVFTAVVYVLTSRCAWRHLPPTFGTSSAPAHRRFTVWTEVGLWRRQAVCEGPDASCCPWCRRPGDGGRVPAQLLEA